MKKVFSILVVAMALVAVSCGGNANKAADQAEQTEVIIVDETIVPDSTACCADSTCCAEGEACKGTAEGCAKECADKQ